MAKKTLLDNIIESIKGIDGRLIKQSGTTEQMISDLNYKVVAPAKSAADSAVAYANDAIEKSKVNSQAIDDINSAVSDAVSDAAVARSDGLRAWNAAQSNVNLIDLNYASASASISSARTEAIAAADEAKASASAAQAGVVAMKSDVAAVQADVTATKSDVAVAKSDIADTKTTLEQTASGLNSKISGVATSLADTASALSDAKMKLSSDVAETKKLANNAQTTADSAVKSAGENAKALTSQANALSDAKKAMDIDVASAKGLANAAQATADNAIKSASSVANDLAAVASQAKANANGITKVTSDVGSLQATVADNSGNISKIQETAVQLQQSVSDNSGAIVVVTQTAQSATTVASDAKSDATVAVQTASGASVTAKNAQGDATTAITTANGAVTQASDAKSNATIAVQTASEASFIATNAQGDASVAKQTASDASVQIKNAQGDISKLQTRAGTIEASVANNSGAIADVQATANQLKASVSDNAGNITVATQTANSAVTVASDARSNATVANQTASQASITANNASGQAASAVLTANGAMTTASDAKSNATVAVQTASGASLTATNANSDATVAKQTASEAKVQASNAESDFAQLSIRANKIEANVADNSGAIASVQQTANGLTTTVADIKANGGGVNLLTGTAKCEFPFNTDGGTQTVQKYDDETNYIQHNSDTPINFMGPWWPLTPEAGQVYTLSADVCGNGYIQGGEFHYEGGDQGNLGRVDLTNDWQRISNTFRVNAINGNWVIYANNSTLLKIKHIKIEKGSVAHDWSPAPEDVQNQFTKINESINGVTTIINDPKTGLNATYQTAAGNATTISNAQGDIAKLKTRADGFDAEFSTANGNISKLQTDASGTKQTLANTKSDVAVLQSRADGLDAKYADAAGDINTLKANASGFSQTLVSAKGDISTLQSTATGLKNTLTDAQGNISTLQSDVAGLKRTTSDHAGNIATLQADAKTLTSQMADAQGNISTLQQTASGFSSKVSGMETSLADANSKINDITSNGGGRNLLTGTQDWQGDWKYLSMWSVPAGEETYAGLIVRSFTAAWWGLGQYYDAKPNTTYTFSFYAKASEAGNSLDIFTLDKEDWSSPVVRVPVYANRAITTEWQRYSITFTTKSGGTIRPSVCSNKGGITIYVAGYMLEEGTVSHDWSPAPEDTDAKITANTTAIEQTKNAITLKADQTTVDKTNGTVQKLQSQLKVQADQIATKVSSSDLDAKGYATQTYTQTQVKQTADSWNANLTSVKDGLTQSYTNLHATVDGIQAQVYNKDGSSKITQLSNLIATKVSSGDYNSQITQLKNEISLRVAKGDVVSQINQNAGGHTLIQVANGKGMLSLNADTVVFTGAAFIPGAAISSISADKIKLGSTSLYNSDGTMNLVNVNDGTTSKITVTQGSVNFDGVNKTASIIRFASDNNTNAFTVNPTGATVTPTLFFERFDQPVGHWLGFTRNSIQEEGVAFNTWDNDGERFAVACHARFEKNLRTLGVLSQGSWDGTPAKPEAGVLTIKNGNTIWSGSDFLAVGSNVTNTYTGILAKAFAQQSTLSAKTNIETVDPKDALNLINQTDIRSYQYKSDVAQGKTKRYTSLIIDDVNDVSQYCAPDEFTNEERTGRDDGSAVGYLFLAVKELTRRIKILEDKLNG